MSLCSVSRRCMVTQGHVVFGVDVGCAWERHAPAWLLKPGWSPALPGKPRPLLALARQLHDPDGYVLRG
jgi:hypothetical protein